MAETIDPSGLALALRSLAGDAHRAVAGTMAGQLADFPTLLGRIADLKARLGEPEESRALDLRLWLENLERQLLIAQRQADLGDQVEDLTRRVARLEGQRGPPAVTADPELSG